jgi:hypothetical protein
MMLRFTAAIALACALAPAAVADAFRPGVVVCDQRYPNSCDVRGWHPDDRPKPRPRPAVPRPG